MRKNWKKILSLVLALAMVLNMNVAAFADEVAPVADPAIEEEAPAADPAPAEAAEEPAAAVEEPAEAEAPAEEAAEAPAAAEPEAAAPVEAEAEKEDAAEGGKEAPEGDISQSGTTVSGVKVTFEKHTTVVSDNKGNLTIKKNGIVGLAEVYAHDPITVTLEDGASVYVAGDLDYALTYNSEDKYDLDENNIDWTTLKNVTFAGSGTLYFYNHVADADSLSVNATNTVNVGLLVDHYGGPIVVSANKYMFSNVEGTEYKDLSGKIQTFDLSNQTIQGPVPRFAASVSASGYSLSVNAGISIYKNGAFQPATTAVSGASVGEGKDFAFGETVFYKNGTSFYYTDIPVKPEVPNVSEVVGNGGELMESAWRDKGIDLDEVVLNKLTFDGDVLYDGSEDTSIEFTLVPAEINEIPAVTTKWSTYTTGAHNVFGTLYNGQTISANTKYSLYARDASRVSGPATNEGFYSDAVLVGTFTTKETPADIVIPTAMSYVYQGDAKNTEAARAFNPLLNGFEVTFKDKDDSTTKKLTVGTDTKLNAGLNGYTRKTDTGNDTYVGLAVKIDGSTVGVLKNYFVLSTDGISADAVAKYSQDEIKAKSDATLKGMRNLKANTSQTDLMYLSANTYYVRSFFEAYETDSYTGTYSPAKNNKNDLPYMTASSNVMTLTVEKAPLVVVPDYYTDGITYDRYGREISLEYRAYSGDPAITTTSGNGFRSKIYAYDPEKESDDNPVLPYQRVANTNTAGGSMYFDNIKYSTKVIKEGIVTSGELSLELDGKKEQLNHNTEKVLVTGASANNVYKLSVSEGTLIWALPAASENFAITYPEYTITVTPQSEAKQVIYRLTELQGYSWYGSDLDTVTGRIYQKYTVTVSGEEPEIEKYANSTTWDGSTNKLGGVFFDEACTQKISSDAIMANVPAGTTVYVSADQIRVISDNWASYDTEIVKNKVIPVVIEPRPIDVYAHAYPYRGDKYEGDMDSAEIYGDVREKGGPTGNIDDITYYDSHGNWYGVDNYYSVVEGNDGKRANFMGEDLLTSTSVKAKNPELVDTSVATAVWNGAAYTKTSKKLELDLKTGPEDKGSVLASRLQNNFYVNTAVGYVTVLPKFTVTYMLQYEDKNNDLGQNKDKLLATETYEVTKEDVKNDKNPTTAGTNYITLDPSSNEEVKKWTKNHDGVLNTEDGVDIDVISAWKYKAATDVTKVWKDVDDYGAGYFASEDVGRMDDYFVNAVVSAKVSDEIKVTSIDPVFYEGLSHVIGAGVVKDNYDVYKVKSTEIDDLTFGVTSTRNGDLIYGKDFTVSYRNNKNASVKYVDDGKGGFASLVKPVYSSAKKKPQVIIKGAGRYRGKFTATVNFDIYPVNIEDNPNKSDYIDSLDNYNNKRYNGAAHPGGGALDFSALNGIKSEYFAKGTAPAKVTYKVQNVNYTPKRYLAEHSDGGRTKYYVTADTDKAKIVTLKKGKDYVEIIERSDSSAKDKNNNAMGWTAITAKEILPGSDYTYRITARGIGNFTGDVVSDEFKVYNDKNDLDISKLKIKVPGSVKWENLMLDANNNILDNADLTKLGVDVTSKKKTTKTEKKKSGQVVYYSNDWTYDIYKIDKKGRIEKRVVANGNPAGFVDAGKYKIVIKPSGKLYETVTVYNSKGEVDSKKSGTYYYHGKVEKTFNVKGITLKASDFKLAWKSKPWSGHSDSQTVTFKKAPSQTFVKNKINQTYVDKYLKSAATNSYDPVWNAKDKRFEAYVRDLVVNNTGYPYNTIDTPDEAAEYICNNGIGTANGDVTYWDSGLKWANPKQIDVYRYTFETAGNNRDVGIYRIYVDTRGVFGTDGLYITYKRTGTANKILSVENAK